MNSTTEYSTDRDNYVWRLDFLNKLKGFPECHYVDTTKSSQLVLGDASNVLHIFHPNNRDVLSTEVL